METFKIEHDYISFTNRVKFYILLFVGVMSLFTLIGFFGGQPNNFFTFILIFGLSVGILIAFKIYMSRFYLMDFDCNVNITTIKYLRYSELHELKTDSSNIDVSIINTSSRSNFNFKLILEIEHLTFEINKDFGWNFEEMKNLFLHVKQMSNLHLTEKEKTLLERIDSHLLKYPF